MGALGGFGLPGTSNAVWRPEHPGGHPPPRRSRRRVILATVVGVLLVAGVAVAFDHVTISRPRATPTSAAVLVAGRAMPDKIGTYARSHNPSDLAVAERMVHALIPTVPDAAGAPYDDPSDPNRSLVVSGGLLDEASMDANVTSVLDALANMQPGTTISDLRPADSDGWVGIAECETASRSFGDVVICGWFQTNWFITFVFVGSDRASVDALMPKVLDAVLG